MLAHVLVPLPELRKSRRLTSFGPFVTAAGREKTEGEQGASGHRTQGCHRMLIGSGNGVRDGPAPVTPPVDPRLGQRSGMSPEHCRGAEVVERLVWPFASAPFRATGVQGAGQAGGAGVRP